MTELEREQPEISRRPLDELNAKATAEERLLWSIFGIPKPEEIAEVLSRTGDDIMKLRQVAQTEEDLLVDILDEALSKILTPREARVMRGRFGLEDGQVRTPSEIGIELGMEERGKPLSRRRIGQIESVAIAKLRSATPFIERFRDYVEGL